MRVSLQVRAACSLSLVLLLVGCGSSGLSDKQVSESTVAQAACSTLKTEMAGYAKLKTLTFTLKAGSYKTAADAMDKLTMTSTSAPNGMALRTGLRDVSTAHTNLGAGIQSAMAKAGLTTIVIADDGSVFGYTTSVFQIQKVDVDPTLQTNLAAAQKKVSDAAQALGLTDCAIVG